jgi:hypothetical protein
MIVELQISRHSQGVTLCSTGLGRRRWLRGVLLSRRPLLAEGLLLRQLDPPYGELWDQAAKM